MGQVPTYGIIGNGRVAKNFEEYFRLEGLRSHSWSRRSPTDLRQTVTKSDVVLLAVSDSAIDLLVQEHPFLKEKPLVHFSGALVSKWAWGAHPLMTFSERLYDLKTYQSFWFLTDEGREFKEFFPTLKNPVHSLRLKDKAFYHSLCVLSGNFSSILWCKAFEGFEKHLGVPREAAFPYMKMIEENVRLQGRRALTGPLIRGDRLTMGRHLEALKDDQFKKVYEAFLNLNLNEDVL